MKRKWLYNKKVIITGASGGIGFAVSKILIQKYGCTILGIARNEEKLKKAKERLGEFSNKFIYLSKDVSTKESWESIRDYLIETDFIPDILINNAGFMLPFAKFEKYSDEEIVEIVNTNLMSIINSTKILIPLLKKSNTPAIINVSSAAGKCAVVGQSMYCATKFAVKGFTDTLRVEYKNQIYVCGIHPGFIKTDILNRQNVDTKNNKLINKMMMPVDKAAKKIVKGIKKRKKQISMGFDGRFLSFCARFMPILGPYLIAKVLKMSKMDLFNDVFEN